MNAETYCPRCGIDKLIPTPGGINEYDSRQHLLPKHETPEGMSCAESTTPDDALRLQKEWEEDGIKPEGLVWSFKPENI